MRRSNVWSMFLLLLFPFGFTGCQPETANDTEPVQTTVDEEAPEGAAGSFEITGEVVSLDLPNRPLHWTTRKSPV